jgi:hypothetical protein
MKRTENSSRSPSRMSLGSAPAASSVETFLGKQALIAAATSHGELYSVGGKSDRYASVAVPVTLSGPEYIPWHMSR